MDYSNYLEELENTLTEYFVEIAEEVERIYYFAKGNFSGKPRKIVWDILDWIDKHMDYHEELRDDLLESLIEGNGNCINYSLITLIMCKAHGLQTYFGVVEYPTLPFHAVSIVDLSQDMFVLDQSPPPVQIGNYAVSDKDIQKIHFYSTKDFEFKRIATFSRKELLKTKPQLDEKKLEKILDEYIAKKYPWYQLSEEKSDEYFIHYTLPSYEIHPLFFEYLLDRIIEPQEMFPFSRYGREITIGEDVQIEIFLSD